MKHFGIVLPPKSGLIQHGPLVLVTLSPPLALSGQQSAPPQAKLMVDTGAQCTVVEDVILQGLGLAPIGFRNIVGVSQVSQKCPVYLLNIGLEMAPMPNQGGGIMCTVTLPVVGMPSPSQPAEHVGLLGRDFLSHFIFAYDGPSGVFMIEMPPKGLASIVPVINSPASPPKALPPKQTKNQRKAARQRQRGR